MIKTSTIKTYSFIQNNKILKNYENIKQILENYYCFMLGSLKLFGIHQTEKQK